MKDRCCPNTPTRKVARSIYETSRDVARSIATTPQYAQSRRDRKKVEMLFAHLKRILKLDRLRRAIGSAGRVLVSSDSAEPATNGQVADHGAANDKSNASMKTERRLRRVNTSDPRVKPCRPPLRHRLQTEFFNGIEE